MIILHRPKNVKVCPGCGTCLINTAKHCPVCGYHFTASDCESHGRMEITLSLPALLGLILFLLTMNTLVILGLQKREQTKSMVSADKTTVTLTATGYVSLTPLPTATRTPAPPTKTPLVAIEYTVVDGDSCLSIVHHFHIYLDALLSKNDIDCSLLMVGTVLKIPPSVVTLEPTSTTLSATPP